MLGGGSLTLPDGGERPIGEGITIGRGEENDVVLGPRTVSRLHAVVRYEDGRPFIEDLGSANGTWVNDQRVRPRTAHPLRHADQIRIGSEALVFSWPEQTEDPDRTEALVPVSAEQLSAQLSPLQLQVVRSLCSSWLAGDSLDALPSNEQIAADLGTPGATETVKAALRRVYAKAGLSGGTPHAKRRALCRIARQRGWI